MGETSLKIAQAVGLPSDKIWAQAYTTGNLALVVVLETEPTPEREVVLAACGKKLLLKLAQDYEKREKENLALLRLLLQKANLYVHEDGASITSLSAFILVGRVLYISCQNADVFLKRGGRLVSILEGEDKTSFASGFIEDQDTILLLTRPFSKAVEGREDELLSSLQPSEIAEILLAEMRRYPEQGKFAALIAKAQQRAPQAKPLLPPPPYFLAKPHYFLAASLFSSVKGVLRRATFTVLIILLALFVLSIFLGVKKRQEEESAARFTKVYALASQKYEEGTALSDLNQSLATKTLSEAKEIIEREIQSFKHRPKEREKLGGLKKEIEEGLHLTLRIKDITEAPVFFDLTLIKEEAEGSRMSSFGDTLLILDKRNEALYTLTIRNKKSQLAAALLKNARLEAVGSAHGFTLSEEGIERVSFEGKKKELVVLKDDKWGKITSIVFFAGNLYLLDSENGQVHKYVATKTGFSEKRNYLAPDIKPNFNESVSMAIDGAIWVLLNDGRILRFLQGVPQAFSVSGLDIPFSKPLKLFTDDESENLYVLDSGNTRIVVLKKDGTYAAQYQWEGIKDVTDLVVSEKEKKILLLSGSKIYSIAISE